MAKVNPYINFAGNTEDAFNFYKAVFGGEFLSIQRFSDTEFGAQMPENEREMIMHVSLPIGSNIILMGTDFVPSMGQQLTPGNNFSLALSTDSVEQADNYFSELSAGGTVTMPLETASWGAYFGMLTDKFGLGWMVSIPA